MLEGVLKYVKELFVEPDGGVKWGSIATTGIASAAGWYFGGIGGAVAGLAGGAVLGGLLDGVFKGMGLNPIRPMPSYPGQVQALQPTRDLPAPVLQQDQTLTNNIVRSPILENLRVPTMTLPNTQRIRTEIAGILRTQVGTERIPGLQRDLEEGERTNMQFNMTFDAYLRSRDDYHRQGGERERLVDSVARATNGMPGAMDRATAEAFVPTLPGLGTDIRPNNEGMALVGPGLNRALLNPASTAAYRAECAKRARGEPHRIFSNDQLRGGWHLHPQSGGMYFVEISPDTVCAFTPSTYDVATHHGPLLTLQPNVEAYARSVFLSTATNTMEQWNTKTTHEKLNVMLTHVEAQRARYERGDQQISWGSLPTPSSGVGPWGSAWRWVSTGELPNANNSTEEECMAGIRSVMVPANGGVPNPGSCAFLRQVTTRARSLAVARNGNGAVAEYDKILRYCDLMEHHSSALGALNRVGVVTQWRSRFRDARLVPAEADAHDFVQHRLPIFNATKIAIMCHGQREPQGVGRGHFITYRDCNQPNAETVTVFCTRQADGTYKVTHAWKGNYDRNVSWDNARLATAVDIDRGVIDALETRDRTVNPQLLSQALRGLNAPQFASLQSIRTPGTTNIAYDQAEYAMLTSGPANMPLSDFIVTPANENAPVITMNTREMLNQSSFTFSEADPSTPVAPSGSARVVATRDPNQTAQTT